MRYTSVVDLSYFLYLLVIYEAYGFLSLDAVIWNYR